MTNRLAGFAVTLALAASVVGCSETPDPEPAPTPAVASSATATAAPTPKAGGGPTESTVEPAECMNGRYRLTRFVGIGALADYGTGEGGDLTLDLDRSDWKLAGAGKKPMTISLAGAQGRLIVDGTVTGTLATADYRADFTVTKSSGTAVLSGDGRRQRLSMVQIASVLAPQGSATLTCTEDKLTMVFESVRLDLERP